MFPSSTSYQPPAYQCFRNITVYDKNSIFNEINHSTACLYQLATESDTPIISAIKCIKSFRGKTINRLKYLTYHRNYITTNCEIYLTGKQIESQGVYYLNTYIHNGVRHTIVNLFAVKLINKPLKYSNPMNQSLITATKLHKPPIAFPTIFSPTKLSNGSRR